MTRTLRHLVLCALLAPATVATAQEPADPPLGPADIISGARQARDEAEMDQAMEAGEEAAAQVAEDPAQGGDPTGDAPAADAPPAQSPTRSPHDRETLERVFGRGRPLATAEASRQVPVGTIRVQVVDADDQPVAGATVRIGVMSAEGGRDAIGGQTDASGIYAPSGLETGAGQSYRVSVPHEGATYAATPFRLEPDRGHAVRIVRVPTTDDPRVLLQVMGQTMLEFRDDRLHVVQQAQLANLSPRTYVFPSDGQQIRLPEGFLGFQSQQSMSDQRLVPDDAGFRVRGSLPPGRATLTWAYDLPLERTAMVLSQPVPWRTYQYRVLAEASPDMRLDVGGFPPADVANGQGRRLLVTQVARTPNDPPLERLEIRLAGIPGPGPWRWIAVGAGLMLLFTGLLLLGRDAGRERVVREAREAKKLDLLEQAAELEQLFAAEEVGPKFRRRRLAEIESELAVILQLEAASKLRKRSKSA